VALAIVKTTIKKPLTNCEGLSGKREGIRGKAI